MPGTGVRQLAAFLAYRSRPMSAQHRFLLPGGLVSLPGERRSSERTGMF